MNKQAQSTGFAWIYGLVMLFGIGILYIVFNQVFTAYLVPMFTAQANASSVYNMDGGVTSNQIIYNINKYMAFFHVLPIILFVCVVIYMIVAAIRKEQESEWQ